MKRQRALITGGTSGIGYALAHELAGKGIDLVLVSNQVDLLPVCTYQIQRKYAVACIPFYCDLSREESAAEVFAFCENEKLNIDILINNAGMLLFSEVTAAPVEKVRTILQLHMNTPVMLCRLFGEKMKTAGNGYILNVSSISSVMPYPGISLYGPSKTFMRYFTRALRNEMKHTGIKITCLIPGATATGLYDPNKVNLKLAKNTGIMQNADFVARKALHALFRDKAECIPGILNKLTVWLLPLIPHAFIQFTHKKTGWVKLGNNALNP